MAIDQKNGHPSNESLPPPRSPVSGTSWGPAILVFCLFLACILTPWWWFHSGEADSVSRLRMAISSQVPGFSFTSVPVSNVELQTLATTNLMSGFYCPIPTIEMPGTTANRPVSRNKIRVFAAEWEAQTGQDMLVVHHTPDVCWVGAGWTPISLGQPTQVLLELPPGGTGHGSPSAVPLPFECRVFQPPGGGARELVLWCTLVGGQVLPEIHLFPIATDNGAAERDTTSRMGPYGRRLAISHLWQLLSRRIPAQSSKQFVRLSVPIQDSWGVAIEEARAFAQQWIKVIQRGPAR